MSKPEVAIVGIGIHPFGRTPEKTGQEQGVLDPEFLQALDRWVVDLRGTKLNGVEVVTSSGLTTLIKETHSAMNGNEQAMYKVPDDRELIAQELLLIDLKE